VLAAVTADLNVGWRNPEIASAPTRLLGFSIWDLLVFLVNAILFILVGLQLHPILSGISGHSAATLLGLAAAVSAAVIATRIDWEFTVPYLIRLLDRRPTQRARRIGARARLVVGWSGMRGAVSLAAALALPLPTGAGQEIPQRDLIIFVTFAVILVTLVLQGLTLPVLIRRLGVHGDGCEEREELRGRLVATDAALARLEELAAEDWTGDDTVERLRGTYDLRRRRLKGTGRQNRGRRLRGPVARPAAAGARAPPSPAPRHRPAPHQGAVSNDVMHRIERHLDLEDSRLEI
jgi:monovalent cation/hydrogen antiporter